VTGEGAWGRARWVIAPHKRGAMAPRFRGQARSARPRSPLLGAIFPLPADGVLVLSTFIVQRHGRGRARKCQCRRAHCVSS
jgi:hypothetical protein